MLFFIIRAALSNILSLPSFSSLYSFLFKTCCGYLLLCTFHNMLSSSCCIPPYVYTLHYFDFHLLLQHLPYYALQLHLVHWVFLLLLFEHHHRFLCFCYFHMTRFSFCCWELFSCEIFLAFFIFWWFEGCPLLGLVQSWLICLLPL